MSEMPSEAQPEVETQDPEATEPSEADKPIDTLEGNEI